MSYDEPNKKLFSAAVKWILFIAALSVIVSVVGYFLGWFNKSLDQISPDRIRQLSQQANNAWQQLKGSQESIKVLETSINDFIVLYGEDTSKWPQGKSDEYLQLKNQLLNRITAYNASCSKFNAMWQDEWRAIPAPNDLPTSCELMN